MLTVGLWKTPMCKCSCQKLKGNRKSPCNTLTLTVKLRAVAHTYEYSPVTLTLTSKCFSVDTGREDRLVTTPLFTVLGTTADSLLEFRWREGVTLACFLMSLGVWRKSWTNSSQSNMRNTRRLLRTTVKQEESFVDLHERRAKKRHQKGETWHFILPSFGRWYSSIFYTDSYINKLWKLV